MTTCARCKIEQTDLFEHDLPICMTCAAVQEEKERRRDELMNVHDRLKRSSLT
jgi:hypothetical protein